MNIIRHIKRNFGSYRAILQNSEGLPYVANLEECSSGYEAFLHFSGQNIKALEYQKSKKVKWKTVYAVEDGELLVCDEDIFRELTVKDVKGILKRHIIEKEGKAFKIYDLVTLN
jgi:hypothetical protein